MVPPSHRTRRSHRPALDTAGHQVSCGLRWTRTRTTERSVGDGASRVGVRSACRSYSHTIEPIQRRADKGNELDEPKCIDEGTVVSDLEPVTVLGAVNSGAGGSQESLHCAQS